MGRCRHPNCHQTAKRHHVASNYSLNQFPSAINFAHLFVFIDILILIESQAPVGGICGGVEWVSNVFIGWARNWRPAHKLWVGWCDREEIGNHTEDIIKHETNCTPELLTICIQGMYFPAASNLSLY